MNPIIQAKDDTFLFELSSLASVRFMKYILYIRNGKQIQYAFYTSYDYQISSLMVRLCFTYVNSTVADWFTILESVHTNYMPNEIDRIPNSSNRLPMCLRRNHLNERLRTDTCCIYTNRLTTSHYIQMGYRSSYHSRVAACGIQQQTHHHPPTSLSPCKMLTHLVCTCVLMLAHSH